MFKYIANTQPLLEVNINKKYTAKDLENILFLVEAWTDTPEIQVVFTVTKEIKNQLKNAIEHLYFQPFFNYNIKEI